MKVGELLVALGVTTPEQVEAALEAQASFGGRLGTNLLELGAVTEESLAAALGRSFGVPARSGHIEVAREALALLRSELADRLDAVPARVDGRTLEVLVADPSDLSRLDQLAFATGKRVRPILVVEARLRDLLRRHYGVERVPRGIGDGIPPPRTRAEAPSAGAPAGDLMDEDAFAALYVEPAFASVATRAADVEAQSGAANGVPPLPPEAARALLDAARDLSAVRRALLGAAVGRLRRALLLEVDGAQAVGTGAAGAGVDAAQAEALRLRLRDTGAVASVVRTRAHAVAPFLRTEQNQAVVAALGGGEPAEALALPVIAAERVVAVLYADGGPDASVDRAAVGELLLLAARAGATWERVAGPRR